MAYRIVCGPDWNPILGDYFQRHGGGQYREGAQCFGMLRDDRIIACVLFDGHNGSSVYMHVASSATRWVTREYIRVVFDYAFRQLGCRVIIGLVAESNLKARRFDEHMGFAESGRIRNGCPDGDLIIYTMQRDECRWFEVAK
jgi:RimJ/RimL family protein N-acetyltransferase